MTKPTQATRVLASLARASDHGLTQGDWMQPGGADGAGRITRLAARVNELRNEGIAIMDDGRRDGFRVYRLVTEASTAAGRERVEDTGGTLFDAPAVGPVNEMWTEAA